MSLLAPLLLVGLIGLALPLAAHLRGRREPRTIAFAGRRFLAAKGEILNQRQRLRDRSLLALRLLLLALVIIALSRPVSRHETTLAVLSEAHDAILLVDGSRSMGLRQGDTTLFAASARKAASIADALPAGSRLGLIGSDPTLPIQTPSADTHAALQALNAHLKKKTPRPGSWRLNDRLSAAVALSDRDDGHPRVIYALSDRTAGGLASLPTSAAEGVAVLPIAIDEPAPETPEIHLGITSASWEPAPEIDPRALRIRAEIRSFAAPKSTHHRQVAVALRISGELISQVEIEVAEGSTSPVEFTYTYTSIGKRVPLAASIELVDGGVALDDALPSDDRRHLWLATDERTAVTLVNGDPSELRTHDEVFFLATALAEPNRDNPGRGPVLHNLAPDQLESQIRERGALALAQVDVLVLANTAAPSEDVAAAIRERVTEGMGLWVTVGERVDAKIYNQRLGDLLPLLLREAVLAGTAPGRNEAMGVGFSAAKLDHPALRGERSDLGLLGARARRIFLLEPDASRPHDIALTYENGAPTLLTRDFGRGRVALLTTSVDRDWSDLPLRPGFVPLALRTIAYLGDRANQSNAQALEVGDVWSSALPGPLTVVTPSGQRIALAADDDGVHRFTNTFELGHYRVEHHDPRHPKRSSTPLLFTVNVDPSESETTPLEIPPPTLVGDQVLATAHVPRWRPLLALAGLMLLIESLLRMHSRWRSRHDS